MQHDLNWQLDAIIINTIGVTPVLSDLQVYDGNNLQLARTVMLDDIIGSDGTCPDTQATRKAVKASTVRCSAGYAPKVRVRK